MFIPYREGTIFHDGQEKSAGRRVIGKRPSRRYKFFVVFCKIGLIRYRSYGVKWSEKPVETLCHLYASSERSYMKARTSEGPDTLNFHVSSLPGFNLLVRCSTLMSRYLLSHGMLNVAPSL